VFDKIYSQINECLYQHSPYASQESDEETDFEIEESELKEPTFEEREEINNEQIKKFSPAFTAKLVSQFNDLNIDTYIQAIKNDFKNLTSQDELNSQGTQGREDNDINNEVDDPKFILEESINALKDYIESSYSQSILIESLDLGYQYYIQKFIAEFQVTSEISKQIPMAKIIPIVYRCRSIYNEVNPVIDALAIDEEKPLIRPVEEQKVVEIESDADVNSDIEDSLEDSISQNIKLVAKNIKIFSKLILTEGIEKASPLHDLGGLLGMGGEDIGGMDLLQSLAG
jgi:hypothetical protein